MNVLAPTVVAVDGEFFLHRVLHIPEFVEMATPAGVRTGGIYGVVTTIQNTLNKFPGVRRCLVVFDSGHSMRRQTLFPEYKMNRAPSPDKEEEHRKFRELLTHQKMELIRNLPYFGVRLATLPCKEGDDILAWLSKNAGGQLVIASEDKDMFQLISSNVAVYRPIRQEFVCLDNFRQMVGVHKALFLVRKAMLGDPSDNIPGVPKAGEVTVDRLTSAMEHLLAQRVSGKLSDVLVEACKIQEGVDTRGRSRYQSVAANLDLISRNLELMDLRREPFTPEEDSVLRASLDTLNGCFDEEGARRFLQEFEFKSLHNSWEEFSRPFKVLR